jgi:hypothetical protein
MLNMEVWDWVMLALGAYVAVTALVTLMRRRRDEVLAELSAQAEIERARKRQNELAEKRKRKQKKAA